MGTITILLAILVWHFVGKDWWQEQKNYIDQKMEERREDRDCRP